MATQRLCSIEGCGKKHKARGLCEFHSDRLKRGAPLDDPSSHASRGRPMAFLSDLVGTTEQECIPWPFARGKHGYGHLKIGKSERGAHRIMCILAHGEPTFPRAEAAHECGHGHLGCVNPNHLSWKTPKANKADMLVHGTRQRGTALPWTKLDEDKVRQIRRLSIEGVPQSAIAAMFGIRQGSTWRVIHRKAWGHVE